MWHERGSPPVKRDDSRPPPPPSSSKEEAAPVVSRTAHGAAAAGRRTLRPGKLVLSSVGMGSELTIGSNSTFLCFNKGGRLVNKRRMSRRKGLCEFREIMRDNYSTFQSVYNGNWYIGFNSKGKPVRGRKVPPHRWFQFMFLKRGNEDIPRSPFANVSQAEWLKVLNDTSTNKS
ncbi:hypothetical protein HPB51_023569 [Rhipicephalus microplus]|uniref:Fibroblast growth factor n=1 Tax=Rhipicephalus microplus TaxID=6941 RepID=A0A9J6DCU8_RHIMP|nr:hypothetical protein HPB51_023569 [Rhipicephalus microplus]